MTRVSNEPLRREYLAALEAGVTPSAVCHAAGFVRASHPGRCDVHRLRRMLGLVETHRKSVLQTVSVERARVIRQAIRECSRWVCASGCGERLSVPGGLCGFCAEEAKRAA